MPRIDVTFPQRRTPGKTPVQEQASAFATTREAADRVAVNELRNAFLAFDDACKRAARYYRRRQWFEGDRALTEAARKVARASGEPFDLVCIQIPRRAPVFERKLP